MPLRGLGNNFFDRQHIGVVIFAVLIRTIVTIVILTHPLILFDFLSDKPFFNKGEYEIPDSVREVLLEHIDSYEPIIQLYYKASGPVSFKYMTGIIEEIDNMLKATNVIAEVFVEANIQTKIYMEEAGIPIEFSSEEERQQLEPHSEEELKKIIRASVETIVNERFSDIDNVTNFLIKESIIEVFQDSEEGDKLVKLSLSYISDKVMDYSIILGLGTLSTIIVLIFLDFKVKFNLLLRLFWGFKMRRTGIIWVL